VPAPQTEPTTEVVARPERAAAAIVPADVDAPAPRPAPIAPAAAPIVPPVAIAPAPAPSSAATTRREPPATPPAAPPSAPVVDEATLLGDAQLAFVGGDPARARALLQTHAREFPDSKLLDVRDLLEARVLCAEGRGDAARTLAQLVADRAPGSAAAKKAAGICPAAKEQP